MIGLLLVPLVIMRELKELKVISMTLFAGIGIFLSLFIFQMIKYGLKENKDVDYSIYWEAKFDTALLTSFAIILVGYGFQQNLFPLFMSLQGNTQQKNKQSKRSIILALSATLIVYMSVGILCLYDFGSELSGNVLDNIDKEVNWSSYVIRSAFLIVLACHIPYIFFSGKESLLIMIEETRDQSMSTAL
jgi:amino acid permease